jgi:glycosyltransferase involved in cell wall biosynthesis
VISVKKISEISIIIPAGPGQYTLLDTIESVSHYIIEPHEIVIVDDATTDGTYEAIMSRKRDNWHILKNRRKNGVPRLVQTLCMGYSYILEKLKSPVILRLDQDALLISNGIIKEIYEYMALNPTVGMFGVYDVDYNRPRNIRSHEVLINKELSMWRKILGMSPSWKRLLLLAERHGYKRGDNVFGGAYFITRNCLKNIAELGGLNVPHNWHSRMMEDVYFSMAAVASGLKLGHFAAPDGPLCLEWRGLPYPPSELREKKYKIIHSVDKGQYTRPEDNEGLSARDYFRKIREMEEYAGQ